MQSIYLAQQTKMTQENHEELIGVATIIVVALIFAMSSLGFLMWLVDDTEQINYFDEVEKHERACIEAYRADFPEDKREFEVDRYAGLAEYQCYLLPLDCEVVEGWEKDNTIKPDESFCEPMLLEDGGGYIKFNLKK